MAIPRPQDPDLRAARLERRRAQVRAEILAATRTVLKRNGTAGFTLEAVAQELQLTKAAIYYYFPSKDALVFAAILGELRAEAEAIGDAVERAPNGPEALRALIETAFAHYRERPDALRLAYLYAQVAGAAELHLTPEMLEWVRPINDLLYGRAQRKIAGETGSSAEEGAGARRLAFLAHTAVIGLLTVKAMVETFEDPLIHSDADLVDDLARVFTAAALAPRD